MRKIMIFISTIVCIGIGAVLGAYLRDSHGVPVVSSEPKVERIYKYVPDHDDETKNIGETALFSRNLTRALSLYRQSNLYACKTYCEDMIRFFPSSAEFSRLLEKCDESMRLIAFVVPINPPAMVQAVQTKAGLWYYGEIAAQDDSQMFLSSEFRTDSPIVLSRSEIAQTMSIPFQEYQKKLEESVRTRIDGKRMEINTILELWTLCIRNNLVTLGLEILDQYEIQEPAARKKLLECQAGQMFQSYLYCLMMDKKLEGGLLLQKISDELSNTALAKQAKNWNPQMEMLAQLSLREKKESPKEPEIKPNKAKVPEDQKGSKTSEDTKASKTPEDQKNSKTPKDDNEENSQDEGDENKLGPEAEKLLKIAKRFYDQGYGHLKVSLPGMPNADMHLEQAKKNFAQAIEYYQKALKLAPDDKKITKKLQETSEYYHHCIKQTRLK